MAGCDVFFSALSFLAAIFFFVLNLLIRVFKWIINLVTVQLCTLLPIILGILVIWYFAAVWRDHHVEAIQEVDFYECEVAPTGILIYATAHNMIYSVKVIQASVNLAVASFRTIVVELLILTVWENPHQLVPIFESVLDTGNRFIRASIAVLVDPFNTRFNFFLVWDGWLNVIAAIRPLFQSVCTDLFPAFEIFTELISEPQLSCVFFHIINAFLGFLPQFRNLIFGDPNNGNERAFPSLVPFIRETEAAALCAGDYGDVATIVIMSAVFGNTTSVNIGVGALLSHIYVTLAEVSVLISDTILFFAKKVLAALASGDLNSLRPAAGPPIIPGNGPIPFLFNIVGTFLSGGLVVLKELFLFINWQPLMHSMYNEACRESGGSWSPLNCSQPTSQFDNLFGSCADSPNLIGYNMARGFYDHLPQCGPQLSECAGYSLGLIDICFGQTIRYGIVVVAKALLAIVDLVEHGTFRFGELLAQPLLDFLGNSQWDDYTSYGAHSTITYNPDGSINERALTDNDLATNVHIQFAPDLHDRGGRPYNQTSVTCLISKILVGKCGTALADVSNAIGHIILIPVLVAQEISFSNYQFHFGQNPLEPSTRPAFNEMVTSIVVIIENRIFIAADMIVHFVGCIPGLDELETVGIKIIAVLLFIADELNSLLILTAELVGEIASWILGIFFNAIDSTNPINFLNTEAQATQTFFEIVMSLFIEWITDLATTIFDLVSGIVNQLLAPIFPTFFGQNSASSVNPGPATLTRCLENFSNCMCGVARQLFGPTTFPTCGCFDSSATSACTSTTPTSSSRKRSWRTNAKEGSPAESFEEYLAITFSNTSCGPMFEEFGDGKPENSTDIVVWSYLQCVKLAEQAILFSRNYPNMSYDWSMQPDLVKASICEAGKAVGMMAGVQFVNTIIYLTDPAEVLDLPEKKAVYLSIPEAMHASGINDIVALTVADNVQKSIRNNSYAFVNFFRGNSSIQWKSQGKNISVLDAVKEVVTNTVAMVGKVGWKIYKSGVVGETDHAVRAAYNYWSDKAITTATTMPHLDLRGVEHYNPYQKPDQEYIRQLARRLDPGIFPRKIKPLDKFILKFTKIATGLSAYVTQLFKPKSVIHSLKASAWTISGPTSLFSTLNITTVISTDNSSIPTIPTTLVTTVNTDEDPPGDDPNRPEFFDMCSQIVEFGCSDSFGSGCTPSDKSNCLGPCPIADYRDTPLCQVFLGVGAVFRCMGNRSTISFFPTLDCKGDPFPGFPQSQPVGPNNAFCFSLGSIGNPFPFNDTSVPSHSLSTVTNHFAGTHMCVLACVPCPERQVVPGFQCAWLDNSFFKIQPLIQYWEDTVGGVALDPVIVPYFNPNKTGDIWTIPKITQRGATRNCGNGIVEPQFGEQCDLGNFSVDPNRTFTAVAFPYGKNYPCSGCNGCFLEFCGNNFIDCRANSTPTDTNNASLTFGLPVPYDGEFELGPNNTLIHVSLSTSSLVVNLQTGFPEECDGTKACSPNNYTNGNITLPGCVRLVCGDGRLTPGPICPQNSIPVCWGLIINLPQTGVLHATINIFSNMISAPYTVQEFPLSVNNSDPSACMPNVTTYLVWEGRNVSIIDPDFLCTVAGNGLIPPGSHPVYCGVSKQWRQCSSTVVYGETCDDGNTVSFDGCSSKCQLETCSTFDFSPGQSKLEQTIVDACQKTIFSQATICSQAASIPIKAGTCTLDGTQLDTSIGICNSTTFPGTDMTSIGDILSPNCRSPTVSRVPNECRNDPMVKTLAIQGIVNNVTGLPFIASVQIMCETISDKPTAIAFIYEAPNCGGTAFQTITMESGCTPTCMYNLGTSAITFAESQLGLTSFSCPSYINLGINVSCGTKCGVCGDGILQPNHGEECDDGTVLPTLNPAEDTCLSCQKACECQPGKPCLGFCFGPDYPTPAAMASVGVRTGAESMFGSFSFLPVPCNAQFEVSVLGQGGLPGFHACGANNMCIPKLCCGDNTTNNVSASLDVIMQFHIGMTQHYFSQLGVMCAPSINAMNTQSGQCCYTPQSSPFGFKPANCTVHPGSFQDPGAEPLDTYCTLEEQEPLTTGHNNPLCTFTGVLWPTATSVVDIGRSIAGTYFATKKECDDLLSPGSCFGCAKPRCTCQPGQACIGRCIAGYFNGQDCDVNNIHHCKVNVSGLAHLGGICVPEVCCGDGVRDESFPTMNPAVNLSKHCGPPCESLASHYETELKAAEIIYSLLTNVTMGPDTPGAIFNSSMPFYSGRFYNDSLFPWNASNCANGTLVFNVTGYYVPTYCPAGNGIAGYGRGCVAVWPCSFCIPGVNAPGVNNPLTDAQCLPLTDSNGAPHPACTNAFIASTGIEVSLAGLTDLFEDFPTISTGGPNSCLASAYINDDCAWAWFPGTNLTGIPLEDFINASALIANWNALPGNAIGLFNWTLPNATVYPCLEKFNISASTADDPLCCAPNCSIVLPPRPGGPNGNILPPPPSFTSSKRRKRDQPEELRNRPVLDPAFAQGGWVGQSDGQIRKELGATERNQHYVDLEKAAAHRSELEDQLHSPPGKIRLPKLDRRQITVDTFVLPNITTLLSESTTIATFINLSLPVKADTLTPLIFNLVDFLVTLFTNSSSSATRTNIEVDFISFFTCNGIAHPLDIDSPRRCIAYYARFLIPFVCQLPGQYDCHLGLGFWETMLQLGGGAFLAYIIGGWLIGSAFTAVYNILFMLLILPLFFAIAWGWSMWCFPITPQCWPDELDQTLHILNYSCIQWPQGFVTLPSDGSCFIIAPNRSENTQLCGKRNFTNCATHGFMDVGDSVTFLLEWLAPNLMQTFRNSFIFSWLVNFPIPIVGQFFTGTFDRWNFNGSPPTSLDLTCFYIVGMWFLPVALLFILFIGLLIWPWLEIAFGSLYDLWVVVFAFFMFISTAASSKDDDDFSELM